MARHLHGNGDARLAYFSDERGVVIYDAFPKGRVHMLVMPRAKELQVGAVWELTPKLLPQLQQFHSLATAVAAHLRATDAAGGAQVSFVCLTTGYSMFICTASVVLRAATSRITSIIFVICSSYQ